VTDNRPYLTRLASAYLTARQFHVGLQLFGHGAPRARIEGMYCANCGHWRDAHVFPYPPGGPTFCAKNLASGDQCPCPGFKPAS
jgi:hypothetical protein